MHLPNIWCIHALEEILNCEGIHALLNRTPYEYWFAGSWWRQQRQVTVDKDDKCSQFRARGGWGLGVCLYFCIFIVRICVPCWVSMIWWKRANRLIYLAGSISCCMYQGYVVISGRTRRAGTRRGVGGLMLARIRCDNACGDVSKWNSTEPNPLRPLALKLSLEFRRRRCPTRSSACLRPLRHPPPSPLAAASEHWLLCCAGG